MALPTVTIFLYFLLLRPAVADSGEDFSNNLFTDLSPLLALFGERVTMQFLSQAMGLSDCIILAVAPLGIITIIVAAIRVSGPPWLKALIGRATEGRAAAELELMSSTSNEIGELWNGTDVVRCAGSAPVWEFVCLFPIEGVPKNAEVKIISMEDAVKNSYMTSSSKNTSDQTITHSAPEAKNNNKRMTLTAIETKNSDQSKIRALLTWLLSYKQEEDAETGNIHTKGGQTSSEQTDSAQTNGVQPSDAKVPDAHANQVIIIKNTKQSAPNISHNRCRNTGRHELRLAACFGILLQLCVILYSGVITQFSSIAAKFPKNGNHVGNYAFPLAVIGTVILNIGMFICSRVVETGTTEITYRPTEKWRARLVWLQREKTVGDQEFKSFALWTGEDQPTVISSSRKRQHEKAKEANDEQPQPQPQPQPQEPDPKIALESLTVVGTAISLIGFFAQFISIRGMHWSVSIASLIAVLVMTVVRAWVRRGLTKPIKSEKVSQGFELDWFANALKNVENAPWFVTEPVGKGNTSPKNEGKTSASIISSSQNSTKQNLDTEEVKKCIDCRHRLAKVTEWRGPVSQEAIAVTRAIEATLNLLHKKPELDESYQLDESRQLDESCQLKSFSWGYNIQSSTDEQEFQFEATRQEDGKWKADAGEIEAALSLRLFYAKHQNGTKPNGIGLSDGKTDTSAHDDKWLRVNGDTSNPGIRILGPNTMRLLRHLGWWVPADGPEILKGKARYIEPKVNITNDAREKHINGNGNVVIDESRVVGIDPRRCRIVKDGLKAVDDTVSQRPQMQSDDAPKETSHSFVEFSERGVILEPDNTTWSHLQFSCPYYWGPHPGRWKFKLPERNEQNLGEERETSLEEEGKTSTYIKGEYYSLIFIKSQDPLELLYAKDMFLTFMWAAVKSLKEPIKGKMEIQTPQATLDNHESWKNLAFRHDGISRLATAIQNTGLCSTQEAFISIISPLSMQQKLPALDGFVEMVREHAKEFEARQAWGDAGKVYLQLGNHLDTVEIGSYTYARAVAVLVAFKKAIEDMINPFKKDDDSTESHSNLKKQLEWTMRNVNTELQRNLESLYGLHKLDIWPDGNITEKFQSRYAELLLNSANVYSKIQDGFWTQEEEAAKTKDIFDRTPLHYCARFCDDSIMRDEIRSRYMNSHMRYLLTQSAGVNSCDIRGWTPLHYACCAGNTSMVRFLLEKEASVNIQGRDGTAPIHCAAEGKYFEIVRILLEYGANIDIADGFGDTALHEAAVKGSVETVETLHKHGYRISRNSHGQTAIHMAAMGGLSTSIYHWVDSINAKDHEDKTPLHLAVEFGHTDFVDRLLKLPVKVNAKYGDKKRTVLHIACGKGNNDVVTKLIGAGAKIDEPDDDGITPLLCAVQEEKENIVKLLTEKGASQDIRVNGETALHFAAKTRNTAIFEHLRKGRADASSGARGLPSKLLHAASSGVDDNPMIPHLVNEFGVGVDETDSNGRTPLHCAALHGNAANIQLLVNGGANKEARDNKGYTPLLTATQHDDSRKAKDCLRVLIKLPNVDVNAADNRGITTLHLIAATKNLADLMPDLINAGAKIEETNTNGETALHCAALIGHKKGIALLVDRGANVEAMDKSKRTPQMIAQSRGLSDWWEEDILPIIESRKKLDQGSGKSSVA